MSVDQKRPRKYRKPPITEYRCQYCMAASPVKEWKAAKDACPVCKRQYDAIAMQECEDG